MNLYFDTEFTGLHKDTTLISIGIVADDGSTFYAEFSDYDRSQCDKWINENVIKHCIYLDNKEIVSSQLKQFNLSGNYDVTMCDSKNNIKIALRDWLKQWKKVQFVSDVCHYDFVLLIDIFGTAFDLPKNVSPVCHDINLDISFLQNVTEAEAFDLSREDIMNSLGRSIVGDKHNSLYDARVIKVIYEESRSNFR